MQYQAFAPISKAEAEESFATDDPVIITEALLAVSLHLPDRQWVEDWIVHFVHHDSPDVRRACALALGHLARLHGEVSPEVLAAISALQEDKDLHGAAQDALDDVSIFTRKDR